jgi:hypothetical protein
MNRLGELYCSGLLWGAARNPLKKVSYKVAGIFRRANVTHSDPRVAHMLTRWETGGAWA